MLKLKLCKTSHFLKFASVSLKLFTAWKVSKYRVFSGAYFPALGLNTERYCFSRSSNGIIFLETWSQKPMNVYQCHWSPRKEEVLIKWRCFWIIEGCSRFFWLGPGFFWFVTTCSGFSRYTSLVRVVQILSKLSTDVWQLFLSNFF